MHRASNVLAVTALITATLLSASPSTAIGETCQGRPATIVGTGPQILGTPGDDVIVTGSSEVVNADAGNDLICISPSQANVVDVYAGDGDDSVDASGFSGRTWTFLGDGRDRYLGGSGADHVRGDGADDDVSSGLGDDSTIVEVTTGEGAGLGRYDGGPGRDTISVWSTTLDIEVELDEQVEVAGMPVADLAGFRSAVVVAPRAVLRGNAEDNYLGVRGCDAAAYGGGGDDYLDGGYVEEETPRFDCDDRSRLVGGRGDDTLRGSNGRDRLFGNGGDDRLEGRSDADLLMGGAGADRLKGGNTGDVLRGGSGNDTLNGNAGNDTLNGNAGRDSADGRQGRDRCVAERRHRCER